MKRALRSFLAVFVCAGLLISLEGFAAVADSGKGAQLSAKAKKKCPKGKKRNKKGKCVKKKKPANGGALKDGLYTSPDGETRLRVGAERGERGEPPCDPCVTMFASPPAPATCTDGRTYDARIVRASAAVKNGRFSNGSGNSSGDIEGKVNSPTSIAGSWRVNATTAGVTCQTAPQAFTAKRTGN